MEDKACLIAVLVLALAAAGTARAASPRSYAADGCPDFAQPKIETALELEDVRHDYTLSVKKLTQMADTRFAQKHGRDERVAGLRVSRVLADGTVTWQRSLDRLGRRICQSARTVKLTITLKPKIYIARENLAGACGRETIAHEMRHVEIDNQMAHILAETLRHKIAGYLQKKPARGPLTDAQSDLARDRANGVIQDIISAEYNRVAAQAAQYQAQVDSPSEYARIQTICNSTAVD